MSIENASREVTDYAMRVARAREELRMMEDQLQQLIGRLSVFQELENSSKKK